MTWVEAWTRELEMEMVRASRPDFMLYEEVACRIQAGACVGCADVRTWEMEKGMIRASEPNIIVYEEVAGRM